MKSSELKKESVKAKKEFAELSLKLHLRSSELIKSLDLKLIHHHKFMDSRKFEFDFAFPDLKLAIEVQGGIWITSGHTKGKGIKQDHDKNQNACALGWQILYCCPDDIKKGVAIKFIEKTIEYRYK